MQGETVTTPSIRTAMVIRTYGPGQAPSLNDTLADIWADSHPELVDSAGAEAMGLSVPHSTARSPATSSTPASS
ncbi:hypothetical protein GCM10010304_77090 [Streptomyces roseoviolaceus]